VDTIDQVRDVAESMCGKHLVLPTSTEQGYLVNCVLVMEHIIADSNFLVSIRYDRAKQCPVIIYSKDGGLTLEKIRKKDPNSIK
jgi:succinyl-CoA synthetase beta subunit